MDNSNENAAIPQFTPEIQEQLDIIDKSLFYTRIILGGVILSYYTILIERQQLVCSVTKEECCESLPDVFQIKMASSIMVLFALYFFFCLAQQMNNQPSTDAIQSNSRNINYITSSLALIAGLYRFYDLNVVENCSPTQQQQEELLEEIAVES